MAYREKQLKEEIVYFDTSNVQQPSCSVKKIEEMVGFDVSQVQKLSYDEKRIEEMMDFWGLQMEEQTPNGSESPLLAPIDIDNTIIIPGVFLQGYE